LSALLIKGILYDNTQDIHQMQKIGKTAYRLSQKIGNTKGSIRSLLFKSAILHAGRFSEALGYINNAESLINEFEREKHIELPRERSAVLIAKSWFKAFTGDFDNGIQSALEGLSIRENLEDKKYSNEFGYGCIDPYMPLALCYILKGDPNSALGYAFKSLEIQKKRDHADLMAGSLTMFGMSSVFKGDINSSIKYCNQALSIAGLKNTWKYMCYITLGKAHIEKGELDTALKYYDKCFDFSKVMGYTHAALALEWLRIGSIHVMKGDLNKALEIYKRSLEISEIVFMA